MLAVYVFLFIIIGPFFCLSDYIAYICMFATRSCVYQGWISVDQWAGQRSLSNEGLAPTLITPREVTETPALSQV